MQGLDRDHTAQPEIASTEHLAPSALADQAKDLVWTKVCAWTERHGVPLKRARRTPPGGELAAYPRLLTRISFSLRVY